MSEITRVFDRVSQGEAAAAEELWKLVYDEMRRIASAKMSHEAATQTLQPAALVHEAWLRLGGDAQPTWQNRAHFFSAAAEAMRRILVERARRKKTELHGGKLERVAFEGLEIAAGVDDQQLLAIHEALD